jgi:hypothetical protein
MRIFAILIALSLPMAAQAQNFQQMNNMLDKMDSPSMWQNAPVSGVPAGFRSAAPGVPSTPAAQSPLNMPRNAFPPKQQPQRGGMPGRFTKQDILKIMFGGSSGSGDSGQSARNSSALGNAQSQLQVARDQAAQAENAASRASYGSDKGARLSAASEAQNHANAARAAADNASSSAYGTTLEASDYAAQARNAANRAQAAADRAQANANGGGW